MCTDRPFSPNYVHQSTKDNSAPRVKRISERQTAFLRELEQETGIPIERWPGTARGAMYVIERYLSMRRAGIRAT